MSIKLKLVKTTAFVVDEVNHNAYVCGYKGRVFNVNTLHFEDSDIVIDGTTLTIKCDVEIVKNSYMVLDEVKTGLGLKPKMDLTVGEF